MKEEEKKKEEKKKEEKEKERKEKEEEKQNNNNNNNEETKEEEANEKKTITCLTLKMPFCASQSAYSRSEILEKPVVKIMPFLRKVTCVLFVPPPWPLNC